MTQSGALVILISTPWIMPTTLSMAGENTHSLELETSHCKAELVQLMNQSWAVLRSLQPLHLVSVITVLR